MLTRFKEYTEVKKTYLIKCAMEGITGTLLTAAITVEIISNFTPEVVLLKTYLIGLPMLIIFVPFIKKALKNHPIRCYKLKGFLSITGLLILLLTELFGASKVWYLVDTAIVSFCGLLMMVHNSYYHSAVVDKDKQLSEDIGYIDLLNKITYIVIGITIIYLEVPTVVLLSLVLPLEFYERYLENKCVMLVYKKESVTKLNVDN